MHQGRRETEATRGEHGLEVNTGGRSPTSPFCCQENDTLNDVSGSHGREKDPRAWHPAAREERCQELQAAPGHLPREDTATRRAAVPASLVPPTAGEADAHDGIPGTQGPLGEREPIKRGVHSPETGLPPACPRPRGHLLPSCCLEGRCGAGRGTVWNWRAGRKGVWAPLSPSS